MGYLMSKTKSWSYLTDFVDDKAKLVFDNLETHTVNVEYAKGNEEHRLIII